MIDINFFPVGGIDDEKILFVVIAAIYKGKWVLCRHEGRITYEFPGGHVEKNESVENAARRELYEETGAIEYELMPICDYSLKGYDGITLYSCEVCGRFFFADIAFLEPLPDYEIDMRFILDKLPNSWTYPEIQPRLISKIPVSLLEKKIK